MLKTIPPRGDKAAAAIEPLSHFIPRQTIGQKQNDVSSAYARSYPVLCLASGPTNSMRGAAYLSGLDDALVIDVGGTTTDVGVIRRGFPREANNAVEIGGVRTLFRMPDLMSLALGGAAS